MTNEAGESPTAKDYSITKEQFKKFIADERAVGMNIVPEIDVPAHALSFTKIWPELKVSNKLHNNNPLIDHFDLTNDAAVTKIKEILTIIQRERIRLSMQIRLFTSERMSLWRMQNHTESLSTRSYHM